MRRWLVIVALAIPVLLLAAMVCLRVVCGSTREFSVSWGQSPHHTITLDPYYIRYGSDVTVAETNIDTALKRFSARMGRPFKRSQFFLEQPLTATVYYSGFEFEEHAYWLQFDFDHYGEPRDSEGNINTGPLGVRRSLVLSLWWPLIISLLIPLLALLIALGRRWRRLANQCRTCGRDLSDSVRYVCPECGSVRIGRVLFTVASALSLLVFVVTVLTWHQTARFSRDLTWARMTTDPDGTIHFGVIRLIGGEGVFKGSYTDELCASGSGSVPRRGVALPPAQWQFWGIGGPGWRPVPPVPYSHEAFHVSDSFIEWVKPPPVTAYELVLPFWLIVLPTIPLPAIWLSLCSREILKRIREKAASDRAGGRCRTCGYNLTGNTSGVCPECGTPINSPNTCVQG